MSSATSVGDTAFCKVKDLGQVKRVYLKGDLTPNYFFKILNKKNYLFFSHGDPTGDGRGNQNVMLDMATGEAYWAPGDYDLVPLQGEDLMVLPHPMRFFKSSDILSQGNKAEFFVSDKDSWGRYQSTALLSKNGNVAIHRILTDATLKDFPNPGVVVKDYKVTTTKGDFTVRDNSNFFHVCRGRSLKLPMLSKDGEYLSALDERSSTTKVFYIGKKMDQCVEKVDLKIATGKADFSYDGNYIAFHKALNGGYSTGWDTTPSKSWHTNAFVYNLKTGETKQLTHNMRGNSFYPIFKRDGTVIMLDSWPKGNSIVYSYNIIDPSKIPGFESDIIKKATECKECNRSEVEGQIVNLAAIGALWNILCARERDENVYGSIMTALSLDPSKCADMIKERWEKNRLQIAKVNFISNLKYVKASAMSKLSVDKLVAACPQPTVETVAEVGVAATSKISGEGITASKCASCHSSGPNKIDFTKLEALKSTPSRSDPSKSVAEVILERIDPKTPEGVRMPLGGQLEDNEVQELNLRLGRQKTAAP